jgi:restriction endonuclease Mrr
MGAVVNTGADVGIFVTPSTFTAPAIQHAETGRVNIRLIDGTQLTQLAAQVAARSKPGADPLPV